MKNLLDELFAGGKVFVFDCLGTDGFGDYSFSLLHPPHFIELQLPLSPQNKVVLPTIKNRTK